MRYTYPMLASLLLAAAQVQAAPIFSGSEFNGSTAPVESQGAGRLWRPAWLLPKPAPNPVASPAIVVPPTERSWGGWMKEKVTGQPAGPQVPPGFNAAPQNDPLSLSRPVEKPSGVLIVSLAQIAESKGNVTEAQQRYHEAVAAEPTNPKVLRAAAHFEDRQNRLAQAEQLYSRAIASEPTNAAVLNDLGLCLARQGRMNEAIDVLTRATRINPAKPLYRNNLAAVHVMQGNTRAALEQMLAVHSPATAHYNVAKLLADKGQAGDALSLATTATQLDPAFTPAQELIATLQGAAPVAAAGPPMTDPRSVLVHENPAPSAPIGTNPLPTAPVATAPVTPIPHAEVTPLPTQSPVVPSQPAVANEGFGPRLLPPVMQ